MSAYGEGASLGLRIAEMGTEAYTRRKEFQRRLAEGSAEIADRKEQREIERRKGDIASAAAASKDFTETNKTMFEQGLEQRKFEESVRHNKETERLAPIIHPPKAAPRTALTLYQKSQLAAKHSKNYLIAQAAGDENGMQLYGKQLTDLGVALPKAPVQEKLGLMHPLNTLGWLYRQAGGGDDEPQAAGPHDDLLDKYGAP